MSDESETPPVPETPVSDLSASATPAPAPAAPAPSGPAPAAREGDVATSKAAPSGFFDKVALAPFYLLALVLGWGVASMLSGNGFATPSWLRCLALWVFFLGAVWSVVFRARVARPAGYAIGCAVLFVLSALFLPHGSLEERTARKKLDAMVADWRAAGYDVRVESLALEEQEDRSLAGTALLRSGRQLFEFDIAAAGAETASGFAIVVSGLDEAENDRLAAIRVLANRLPPPSEAEAPDGAESPSEASK